MANYCEYKVTVKGRKNACYAFFGSMSMADDPRTISETGDENNFTLQFEGTCKWDVDSYCTPWEGEVPVQIPEGATAAYLYAVDYQYKTVRDRSRMFQVEVWCNSADIDGYNPKKGPQETFEHYINGKAIRVECPEELRINKSVNRVTPLFSKEDIEDIESNSNDSAEEFVIEDGVLKKYNGSGSDVTIPEGVKVIADDAFLWCKSLTNITIPFGVTDIGDSAFSCCENLGNVTIPDSVTRIGPRAFFNTKLKEIAIPNSVTSLGFAAFSNCKSLLDVTIPDSVTDFGGSVFSGSVFASCSSLTNVVLPKNITRIDDGMFQYCRSLRSITIPDGVISIGDSAFEGCTRLESVVIPQSVTTIMAKTFFGCTSLTEFRVLNPKCKIGAYLFGPELPSGLDERIASIHRQLTDKDTKEYLLKKRIWEKLTLDTQADIFLMHQGKSMVPDYAAIITNPDLFGQELLVQISQKPSTKECAAVATFMTMFSQTVAKETLQNLYEALKSYKNATKALASVEADAAVMARLNG